MIREGKGREGKEMKGREESRVEREYTTYYSYSGIGRTPTHESLFLMLL
jgi:hypothetical protein